MASYASPKRTPEHLFGTHEGEKDRAPQTHDLELAPAD